MSQDLQIRIEPRRSEASTSNPAAVTVVGTGLTTIATIRNDEYTTLCFQFDVATQNLDDFDVLAVSHPSATQVDFTPSSWSSLPSNGRIVESGGSTTNLAAVAAAGNGYFVMDVTGLTTIVIKASAAADSAAVTSRWTLQ